MSMSRLTLTAPAEVITLAEEQAKREKTSISAMFVSFVMAKAQMGDAKRKRTKIGPLTQALSGSVTLPDGFDEKEFMSNVMAEKYGVKS